MHAKTVAILESRPGEQIADLIDKRGGRAVRAPALAEVPDIDAVFISRLVEELGPRPVKAANFQTDVGTHALFRAPAQARAVDHGARRGAFALKLLEVTK